MGILSKFFKRKTPEEIQAQRERAEGRQILRKYRQEDWEKSRLGKSIRGIERFQQRLVTKQIRVPYQKGGKTFYRMETRIRGRQPVSPRIAQAIAGIGGRRLPLKIKGKYKYSRPGRPRGPSGRYFIPGKGAVGVYEFRKWFRKQKAMQRLMQQQRIAQYPEQYPQTQQYAEMPQEAIQISQLEARRQQILPQPIAEQPPQIQPQPTGLSLMSGWDLLKIGSPFSQSSQQFASPINFMKGASAFNVERPVTNPDGDYYTEPDFFTGRQVLKRRIRDRSFQNV